MILELLAQNMVKHGYNERKNEEEGGSKVKKAKRDHQTFTTVIVEVAAKNEKEIVPISCSTTEDGKFTGTASNNLAKALVYNHLQKVSPTLAAEFSINHKFQLSSVKLEKVIEVYSQSDVHDCDLGEQKVVIEEGSVAERKVKEVETQRAVKNKMRISGAKGAKIEGNKCPDIRANLTLSLVYNHLKKVSPKSAAEFAAFNKFTPSPVKLQEVVKFYSLKKCIKRNTVLKESTAVGKKVNVKVGGSRIEFTLKEDEIIRSAMNEAEASGKTVDKVALAKKLDRNSGSVYNRIVKLSRSWSQKKKSFTLVEDLTMLETLIIPRLGKLSEVFLRMGDPDVCDLSKQWNRGSTSLMNRWLNILQPMLLQHYSGTLNLRVERMLANHIAENCTDFAQIDWDGLAAKKEFAGHTERSLRNMYFFMSKNTKIRLNVQKSEVNPQHIAQYSEEVYGDGGMKLTVSSSKMQRQREVIAFFMSQVGTEHVVDFL